MSPSRGRGRIASGFLQVGATAYGGPAIMGVVQAEFQERRQGTSKLHFLEGPTRRRTHRPSPPWW